MDSITHAILGASIAEFLGGKRYGNRAALIGAIVVTIPDLDVFIGNWLYSDPIQAELFHRGPMHSVLFTIVMAPIAGWIITKVISWIQRNSLEGLKDKLLTTAASHRRHRTIISFRCLASHWMLDMLTGYGTRWLRPFSNVPFTGDSIFIVDPLYTVPFFILLMAALFHDKGSRKRSMLNILSLIVSTSYLLRGIFAKERSREVFSQQLDQQGIAVTSLHTSPEILTSFLRRGRAEDETNRYIGRWSIFDTARTITRKVFPKNYELLAPFVNDLNFQTTVSRRKYNVVARSTPQGVQMIPIQFGDLLGWTTPEEKFMFSYTLYKDAKGTTTIYHSGRFAGIPDGRFSLLLERIRGV